jgi:hypothetical protein
MKNCKFGLIPMYSLRIHCHRKMVCFCQPILGRGIDGSAGREDAGWQPIKGAPLHWFWQHLRKLPSENVL